MAMAMAKLMLILMVRGSLCNVPAMVAMLHTERTASTPITPAMVAMQYSSDGRYATHRENCKHTNNTSDGRYATHRDNCKQYLEYQKLFEPVECLSLNPANAFNNY
jgi:hypothetical protein